MPTPPVPITPWAPDTNYPGSGHAWSGQPVKVTPAYVEFQPSPAFAPTSQEFNYILATRDAALNATINYVNQTTLLDGLLNWNPYAVNLGAGGTEIVYGCAWDAFAASWVTVINDGGLIKLFATSDGGRNWYDVFFNMTTAYLPMFGPCVAVNPTTGAIVVMRIDLGPGTGNTGNQYVSSRGSFATGSPWVDLAQTNIANSTLTGVVFFAPFSGSSGTFIFVGSTGAGAGSAATSLTAAGNGSWSAMTLPGGWSTVAGTISGYLAAVNSAGTQAIVALCGKTPGSADRSRLLQVSTMTDVTPALLSSGAEQIRGICYGKADALWGMVTTDSSGVSRVYTSPDLVTWTSVATLSGTVAAGIAVVGTVWALYVNQTSNPLVNRVILSPTIAAGLTTWTPADFADVTPITGRASALGTFLSNGSQLLAAELDNSSVAGTGSIRVSLRVAS